MGYRPGRRHLLFAALAGLVSPRPSWALPEVSLPFEKFTLANGMTVIVSEDHRLPVVAVNLWYHVGSKDEEPGQGGLAHLVEHLMFEGSRHVEQGMFFRYLDSVGATERNGTTNTDRTTYFETLPRGRLELALWLESDRMAFLAEKLKAESLERQREVVKNERRERYDNVPYGLVAVFVRAALFPAPHPYRGLAIGTPAELEAVDLDAVRSFLRAHYLPGNASLVIAGDLDPAGARGLVQRYFGPIVPGSPAARRGPLASTLDREVRLSVEADTELGRLHVAWATPPYFSPGDADLSALAKILAVGRSSRFERRLVRDLKLAQAVWAQQASAELASVFEIVITLRPGASPDAVLKVVDEELDALRQQLPSAEEVARARAWLTHGLVIATERVSVRANALNLYEHFLHDPGFFPKDLARLDAVTGESIQKALTDHLARGRRVVAVVAPSSSAPRAGVLRGQT